MAKLKRVLYYTSDPINGITSLELTKRDDSVNVEIFYSNTTTFDASRKIVCNASSPTNFSTDFNGYKPKYIGIYALADSSFDLGKIEFDCVDHYYTLGVLSKNDAYSTVSEKVYSAPGRVLQLRRPQLPLTSLRGGLTRVII